MFIPLTVIGVLCIVGNTLIRHRYTVQCNLIGCAVILLDYYIV